MRHKTRILFIIVMLISSVDLEPVFAQNTKSVVYTNSQIEQSEEYVKGNPYQKDLLLFFDMLQSSHPAFSPGLTPPINIGELRTSGYEWAGKCNSQQDLWFYLQAVVSNLNDGHTSLIPDYNNSRIYPFMFLKIGSSYYLYTVSRQFSPSLGKQIIKINDYPIKDVIESFRTVFCSDNDQSFNQKVRNQISFETLWSNNQYKSPDSVLKLTFSDNTTINIEAVTAENRNLTMLQTKWSPNTIRQNGQNLFLYKIIEDKKICYLQFNICEDQSSLRLQLMNDNRGLSEPQIEQILSKYPRFDLFLNEMFNEIEAKNIKTLVIDVRNNSGGNSSLCDILLSWLKPVKDQISGKSYCRLSTLWERNYPQLAQQYKEAFTRNGMSFQQGNLYDDNVLNDLVLSEDGKYKIYGLDYDELFTKNFDENKVFKGNIIFIQDEGTYSSAGLLITDAVDNKIGMVIGSKSAFKPCHYGDVLTWELPNTGIDGFVSFKIFNRPAASLCNELNISPYIDIHNTWNDILDGNDPYWTWVLTFFGHK